MIQHIPKMVIFNSTTHFVAAHKAELECGENPTNVIIAIVFAYAGVEAFVGELVHMAETWQDEGEEQDKVIAFAEMAAELEESRASVVSTLQIFGLLFSEKPFTRGSGILKEIVLLSRLRNALVHPKPDAVIFDDEGLAIGSKRRESLLHQLSDRNLIPESQQQISSWVEKICTKEVASWANGVSVNLVEEIARLLPESGMLSFVDRVQVVLAGLKRPT